MEWRKAKTILILTFLVLNILIGYQLWINTDIARSFIVRSELRQETFDKLETKGIELEAELPSETPNLQEITVFFASSGIRSGPKPLDISFHVDDIDKKKVTRKLTELIPEFERFSLDPVSSNDREIVFYQLHEGWPMFEVNLQFIRNGDIVDAYTLRYATVEEHAEIEEQSVLSAYKAVGVLADHVLGEGSIIVDVQLGYHGQEYSSNTQVLAPKWRVATDNGEIYYVHAISGAVEKKE